MIDGSVAPLARTLDQELVALVRGASFECLVCGEFVMHLDDLCAAPSAGRSSRRAAKCRKSSYPRSCRPGDRGALLPARLQPDGIAAAAPRKVRTPQGRTLGKSQAAKADGKWHRKETAGGRPPVRVKRWGKSPPATVATRRLAKPRPVQGEAGSDDAAR